MDSYLDRYRIEPEPLGPDADHCWSIRRVKVRETLVVTLFSDKIFGIRTHFWNRRTAPCLTTGCPACEHHQVSRWQGYLLGGDHATQEKIVLEVTAAAAPPLLRVYADTRSLHGLVIKCSRVGDRPNGRVRIVPNGQSANAHRLPLCPPIWPIVAHIWGISASGEAAGRSDRPIPMTEAEWAKWRSENPDDSRKSPGHAERLGPIVLPDDRGL